MSFDLYLMCCNIMIYGFKSNVNQGLLRKRDVIGLLKNEEIISNIQYFYKRRAGFIILILSISFFL